MKQIAQISLDPGAYVWESCQGGIHCNSVWQFVFRYFSIFSALLSILFFILIWKTNGWKRLVTIILFVLFLALIPVNFN